MTARVLTVAESDSSGGSGIQADVKTILALGGYATTVLTGVTAQDTTGIKSFQMLDPLIVAEQMRVVLDDIGTDAIKTGVLNIDIIVDAVGDILDQYQGRNLPIVVDPALVSREGKILADETAIATIKRRILVHASVVTPNVQEAELMTGMTLRTMDDMRHAAGMMRTLGADAVLLKCGEMNPKVFSYLLFSEKGEKVFEHQKVDTRHTLGAGCTLSSAIAVGLAQGMDVASATERGLEFLHLAILHAPGYGAGCGPVNHAFDTEKYTTAMQVAHVRAGKASSP
jgi:hydroxymethylpyrimidine/phosphomethylpyrimidine kinase